ncbi:hypothetical protein B484DRAFT_409860, partial [Ochromonadaceae sp. CCMP2298]
MTGGVLYFAALIASSEADTTVSLTQLSGDADMYLQAYSATQWQTGSVDLPDPTDPSSYLYTTQGTEDDHIFLPGPHREASILIVAVQAVASSSPSSPSSTLRFSIVASSSQYPVLLQAGVPQSHYVQLASTETFKFFPHADEDLHITLTARSGDPDLFVSTASATPHCDQEASAYFTSTACSNYTWSSRSYMTDQMVISRDFPCTAVMASTYIDPNCDPLTSFTPATGQPVYIGVYGFSAAQFTLTVAPVGQQVQLLAGQPQLSRTSAGFICSARSAGGGACLPTSPLKQAVQVAYFAFRVAAPSP